VLNGENPTFDIVSLNADVYINKELEAELSYAMPRSELLFRGRDVRREYLNDSDDERETGFGLGWYWRLGPRTQLFGSLYGARIDFRGTDVVDKLAQVSAGVSRLLGQKTLVNLNGRYDRRRSNTVQQANVYTEQAIVLSFTRSFGREGVAFGGRDNLPTLRF